MSDRHICRCVLRPLGGTEDFPVTWDCVMDRGSCEICSELDGKVFRTRDELWSTLGPVLDMHGASALREITEPG